MVAEELRRRIEAGAIPAGALLPPESALVQEFGISRGTAREAIAALRAEGLVVTEHGRGTYARPKLPVRRLSAERYRREAAQLEGDRPPETSFTADRDLPWSAYQLDATFDEVPATRTLAELFGVEAGTMLLQRRFVFHAHGVPEQLATSYYLLDIVAGTPLADPSREPWPGGNTAQLHSVGIAVTNIREVVRARMPTAEEGGLLHLASGVPVLAVTRRTFAGDRVVEVAQEIVMPADRAEIEYEMPLT